ncbi:MAG: GUN4 domain-containing protein [Elainellaceae cyanobacterium]
MSNENAGLSPDLDQRLAAIEDQLRQLRQALDLSDRVSQLEDNLLLVSEVYRYEKLRNLLAAGQWRAADEETIRVILDLAGEPDIEELTPEQVKKMSCSGLQVVDRLWRKYSGDRFGFSIQLKLYQEVGGDLEATIAQDNSIIKKLGERTGWWGGDRWLSCDELDYSLSAPVGCHPSRWWNSPFGSKMTNFFLGRLLTCDL